MKTTLLRNALLWAAMYTSLLGGCGVFPDKEKDYIYSHEIERLALPPDLAKHSPSPGPSSDTRRAGTSDTASDSTTQTPRDRSPITATLLHSPNQAPRLRIDDDFDKAWLAVTKALSRHHIEISDRNRAEGLLDIRYPPRHSAASESETWWDELLFIFGGGEQREKHYLLQLQPQTSSETQLIVLDANKTPPHNSEAQAILELLERSINHRDTTPRENEKAPDD